MHKFTYFRIAFFIVTIALGSCGHVARAQNPPPPAETFTGTAKVIVDGTGAIANLFGTYQAVQALALAFGLLDDPNRDVLNELQTLHRQIDQVASEIIWFMAETDREKRLKDLNSSVHTTRDALAAAQPIDWFYLDDTTSRAVDEGAIPNAFKRHYRDSDTDGLPGEGNVRWKYVIAYTPDDLHYDNNDGSVYDWRLGVPALSQLIALRLMLMELEDPHFTTNGRFHDTLMDFHDALTSQITAMNTGVRCNVLRITFSDSPNFGYVYWLSCADIYSGLNETHQLRFTTDPERHPDPYADYSTWYQWNVQAVQDPAYRHVRSKTSVFGVQALADTLYLFANNQADLTRTRGRIPSNADPSLCLAAEPYFLPGVANVVWDNAETQLSPCAAVNLQRWTYDRQGQTIVHVTSGKCLDTATLAVNNLGTDYLGNPALLRDCNGGDSQRWTYDPQTKVLFNGLGVALDIRGGNITAGARVETSPRNNGLSQQWLADQSAGFSMSVAPTSVSIAANDSASVHLSTTMLEDARQINLTYNVPSGVVAGQFAPRSVTPGQGVDIGFAVPLGTPPGNKGPITIVGNNGLDAHSVTVDVTTTACLPTTCQANGVQCGSISDHCGHALSCGDCGTGLACSSSGMCLPKQCTRPRPCPKGFHWDDADCACVAD